MKFPIVYGATHDADTGEVTARTPRAIKVNIGKPKDSGLHIFMAPSSDKTKTVFALEIGRAQSPEIRTYDIDQIAVLKRDYQSLLTDKDVVKRKAPVKLPYFTFLREAGDGTMVHDIDVIAKHGIRPREIDIIITEDAAFRAAYEMWSAKGLSCHGDGRDAMRSVNFTPTKEDEVAAEQAKSMGRKWFPIMDGCFTRGCPFALPTSKGYKQCGLSAALSFQLVNDIRLGAKAEYHTTGGKSTRQLLASLMELASFTGGGDPARGTVRGIPLVMSVGQFKTNHNNQPGTAYAVRLEFRAESVAAIQRKLREAAETFGGMMPISAAPAKQIAPAAQAQIISAPEEDPEVSTDPSDDETEATFMRNQFSEEEDADETEPVESETFDAAKADLMMKAETAETAPAETVTTEPIKTTIKFGGKK